MLPWGHSMLALIWSLKKIQLPMLWVVGICSTTCLKWLWAWFSHVWHFLFLTTQLSCYFLKETFSDQLIFSFLIGDFSFRSASFPHSPSFWFIFFTTTSPLCKGLISFHLHSGLLSDFPTRILSPWRYTHHWPCLELRRHSHFGNAW